MLGVTIYSMVEKEVVSYLQCRSISVFAFPRVRATTLSTGKVSHVVQK